LLSFIERQAFGVGFQDLVNMINYGYPGFVSTIEIECLSHNPSGLELINRDNGIPYNPLSNQLKF
jgi:hypothetical protein